MQHLENVAEGVLAKHGIHAPADDGAGVCNHSSLEYIMDIELSNHRFRAQLASVVLRGLRVNAPTMRLTMLIVADWDDGWDDISQSGWEAAAHDLNAALARALEDLGLGLRINVEFLASHLSRSACAFPVADRDLQVAWKNEIMPRVVQLVNSQPEIRDYLNTVALYRIGFKRHWQLENPLMVYIGLDNACNEICWPALSKALRPYLGSLDWKIGLCIEHNQ